MPNRQNADVGHFRFDLLFERFLNPERVSMPDIGIDYHVGRRGEANVHGERSTAATRSVVVTFGTLKSRRGEGMLVAALSFTPAETDALAKLIPNAPNYSLTVKEAIDRIAKGESSGKTGAITSCSTSRSLEAIASLR